jgi:hypothetical protein
MPSAATRARGRIAKRGNMLGRRAELLRSEKGFGQRVGKGFNDSNRAGRRRRKTKQSARSFQVR